MPIFTWRLIQSKLPTKDYWAKHRVTHMNFVLCSGGCGINGTVSHLCFDFNVFGKLWWAVTNWLGINTNFSIDVYYHVLQFGTSYLFKKEMHKCLSAIWVTWCWLIWKERNHIIFARKKLSIELVLDKLKILVWCYLKFKKKLLWFEFVAV
jgi:hypothetical protein